MKSVVRVFFFTGSLLLFAGCRFTRDRVVEEGVPAEAKQVIADLGEFLSDGKRETIELDRSDVENLLTALGLEKTVTVPKPAMEDLTVTLEFVKSVTAVLPELEAEKIEPSRGAFGKGSEKDDSAGTMSQSTEKPGGKSPLLNAAEALPGVAPDVAVLPQESAGEVGRVVPEGFQAEITEPTTGAKFLWDGKRNWWRSDKFETYLKGSKAQNDSFCWLLTANSQSVGTSDIPNGWSFQALGNGKDIVIAQTGRDLTLVEEIVGDPPQSLPQITEAPTNQPVDKSDPIASVKVAAVDAPITTTAPSPVEEAKPITTAVPSPAEEAKPITTAVPSPAEGTKINEAAVPAAPKPGATALPEAVAPGLVGRVSIPDGFQAEIIERTTGAKFLWDSDRGWWHSDGFESYLKGSKAQNDSFCWLLTANSQSAGAREIPEGWTFRPLGDGKGIVLARMETIPKTVREKGAGETKSLETTAVADELGGEQKKGTRGAEVSAAPEKGGGVVAKPTEPIKEEVPPASGPAEPAAKTRGIPQVVNDPPAVRRPEEVPRMAKPMPEERSKILPPGASLPDGKVPSVRSDPGWFRPLRPPQSPLDTPGNGGSVAENPLTSGNTEAMGSGGGPSTGESVDTVNGNPETNPSSKPRLRLPFFNSRKAETRVVIPEEQKPQGNE